MTPTPPRDYTWHLFWPAFRAAVERGSYDEGQFWEFCGYMNQKTDEGQAAEVEDAEPTTIRS